MLNERIKPWIGFNLVKGIGPARLKTLIEHFGSVSAAWDAPVNALQQTSLGAKLVDSMVEVRSSGILDRAWEYLQQNKIGVIIGIMESDSEKAVMSYLNGVLATEANICDH